MQRFLENGDKAKVVIFFKGRDIVHREFGQKVLERVAEQTEDIAVIEQSAKQEGRTLFMILAPKSFKSKKGSQPKASKPAVDKTEEKINTPEDQEVSEKSSTEAEVTNNES